MGQLSWRASSRLGIWSQDQIREMSARILQLSDASENLENFMVINLSRKHFTINFN